jgi:hypothetical protein
MRLTICGFLEILHLPTSTHIWARSAISPKNFLCAVFVLICSCRGQPDPYSCELTREDFLANVAPKLYDKRYAKLHELYLKKGKSAPIFLPPGPSVIKKYLGSGDLAWKEYVAFAKNIRDYRNKIVHDVAIGTVLVQDSDFHLVPRKECIQNYGEMRPVEEAAKDPEVLKKDFVVREEQMSVDLRSIQKVLNSIWEKPIVDLCGMLYDEQNSVLMQKYNLP